MVGTLGCHRLSFFFALLLSYSVFFLVEEGTQGLHYCRMETFCDDLITNADDETTVHQLAQEGEWLCSKLMGQSAIRQKIEAYHGMPPFRDMEGFSLWLCGVCVINGVDKMTMLSSSNTLERMRVGVEGLRSLLQRIEACRSRLPVAAPTAPASPPIHAASGSGDLSDSHEEEEEEEVGMETEDESGDGEQEEEDSSSAPL